MTATHVLDDAQLRVLARQSSQQHAAVLLAIDHLAAVPDAPRAALLAEARGWLVDCGLEDAGGDQDVDDDMDVRVRDLVYRLYEGGWPAFVVANVDQLELDREAS